MLAREDGRPEAALEVDIRGDPVVATLLRWNVPEWLTLRGGNAGDIVDDVVLPAAVWLIRLVPVGSGAMLAVSKLWPDVAAAGAV